MTRTLSQSALDLLQLALQNSARTYGATSARVILRGCCHVAMIFNF